MKVMSCPDCGSRLCFSTTYSYQCSHCRANTPKHYEAFTLFEKGHVEMISEGWKFDESGNQYADFLYEDSSVRVLSREDVFPM